MNLMKRRSTLTGMAIVVLGAIAAVLAWSTRPERSARADDAKPPVPALIRSAKSGPWSAGATWEGGRVPGTLARVQIREGHRVLYDVHSDQVIRSIHVAGTLEFARDKDTRLDVGLIKIQAGEDPSEVGFDCEAHLPDLNETSIRPALEIGTPGQPLPAGRVALIRLTAVEGLDMQSCPAIVCCGGRMDLHGSPLSRTWVKLGETAKPGDATVVLAEPVQGWKAGDKLILTPTRRDYKNAFTEERTIREIDGTRIALDSPLEYEHLGQAEYRGEVANLSRNVIVESADPAAARGHTMYHRGSKGSISYAEFRHLGKEGVLGRYSLHFHLVGNTMRGSSVVGASIWDSGNRWLTIHGTNYLVVRDCVGYRSIGHGFFLEDGTEVYNLLDRNLAVGARRGKRLPKQVLPFDANEGAGYWWANSLNTFTRNIAAGNDAYGYRFEATQTSALKLVMDVMQPDGSQKPVDIRTLPFVRFDDNEAHSSVGLYGCNLGEGVNRVGPDTRHPFIVRNLKLWDLHYAFRPQVPSLRVENLQIHQAAYGIYHPNYDNHEYQNVYIGSTNTEPFNRGHDDLSVQYGMLSVDGLTFDNIRSGGSMPLIQISDDNPTGNASSHFRNVKTVNWTGTRDRAMVNLGGGPRPSPNTPTGVPIIFHDWFGAGRDARIVSTKTSEPAGDKLAFREEPLLTGDESRVAEVPGSPFPQLLNPVDDLPPATVITNVAPLAGGKLLVRGVTSDNGAVKSVTVNGSAARSLAPNFADWEVTVAPGSTDDFRLKAHAEDESGNVELLPHVLSVPNAK